MQTTQDRMSENTFYTDHWRHIEDERVARYEQMFQWRDGHAAMLDPLDLRDDSRVLDYGSGPGAVALGIAEHLVGPAGRVYGVDLNARFVADASRRAGDVANVSYHALDAETGRIPLPDDAVDRLLCKNVLEYVPDVAATLAEFRRVLEPGGRFLAIDSDWAFVVVEPWGRAATERFFDAASPAFKTPEMGRTLRAAQLDAGFVDVEVNIRAGADTTGGSLPVLRNMASYAQTFDRMPSGEVAAMLAQAEAAVDAGRYLFVLPQFFVTCRSPTREEEDRHA